MYIPIVVEWYQTAPPNSNLFPNDTQISVDLLDIATHDISQAYGVYDINNNVQVVTPGPRCCLAGT